MQAFALTDIGKRRETNQDFVFESTVPVGQFRNLFILADGMGGHKAGDYASKYLTTELVSFVSRSVDNEPVRTLQGGITLANSLIYAKANEEEDYSGMGTTVVAATISDGFLTAANVGDSRLYIINNEIRQITRDHSLVEELAVMGAIERGSDAYKRKKNIITRAVGIERDVRPDFYDEKLQNGDYILLCSDGLTNMVDDDEILSLVTGNGSVEHKARELVRKANEHGGSDNIAIILIRYTEGGDANA